jgi:exosome complex exonuclease DIS3/RRP44
VSLTYISPDATDQSEAALKNDDADESDEEGERVVMEEKTPSAEIPSRTPAEKQPTGRIVGIIKRNWRA